MFFQYHRQAQGHAARGQRRVGGLQVRFAMQGPVDGQRGNVFSCTAVQQALRDGRIPLRARGLWQGAPGGQQGFAQAGLFL